MHLNWHSEVEKMNTESPCNSITVWICYVLSVWITEHHQLPWNSVFLSVKKDNTSWSFCNNHIEEWDKSMWNRYQTVNEYRYVVYIYIYIHFICLILDYKWCINYLLMLMLAVIDKPHNKLKNKSNRFLFFSKK